MNDLSIKRQTSMQDRGYISAKLLATWAGHYLCIGPMVTWTNHGHSLVKLDSNLLYRQTHECFVRSELLFTKSLVLWKCPTCGVPLFTRFSSDVSYCHPVCGERFCHLLTNDMSKYACKRHLSSRMIAWESKNPYYSAGSSFCISNFVWIP